MSSFASFWESLSAWEKADIVGLLMVAIGVLGELALRFEWLKKILKFPFNPTNFSVLDFRKNLLEIIFELLVFIGLGIEVYALPNLINESHVQIAGLNKQTEQLQNDRLGLEKQVNETKTQLANAERRLNESVLELKNASLPMDIGEQYSFENALKPLAGIQVELRSLIDINSQMTANSLLTVFNFGGWQVINTGLVGDIGEKGVVIGDNDDENPKKAAHFLLKLLTERNVPAKVIDDRRGWHVRVPTNAIIVAVCSRPSKLEADLMALEAKEIELKDQDEKDNARYSQLVTNRYFAGSKELAAAQAEFNDLSLKQSKRPKEEMSLIDEKFKLLEQINVEEYGTNASASGIHVYGGNMPPSAFGAVGTNSANIFMYGTHLAPTRLQ